METESAEEETKTEQIGNNGPVPSPNQTLAPIENITAELKPPETIKEEEAPKIDEIRPEPPKESLVPIISPPVAVQTNNYITTEPIVPVTVVVAPLPLPTPQAPQPIVAPPPQVEPQSVVAPQPIEIAPILPISPATETSAPQGKRPPHILKINNAPVIYLGVYLKNYRRSR